MNHCVPNFDMDENFSDLFPTASSSGSARQSIKKSATVEDDIMELLWQNGQVVMHTQNHRSCPKSNFDPAAIRAQQPVIRPQGEVAAAENRDVVSVEDEMASWLQYPLHEQAFDGRDLYSDLLYPPAASCAPGPAAIPPRENRPAAVRQLPIQIRAKCAEIQDAPPRIQNFGHFSRLSWGRADPGPSSSSKAPIESTIVDSCETPQFSRANARRGNGRGAGATALPSAGAREESVTCEQTVTSSPGGSEDSGSAGPSQYPEQVSWKRKQRDADEMEGHSEDMDLESLDTKKECRSGCNSTKRSRAAQVHNLSERRRRDRINEKMKALQELIPRCTKGCLFQSDKASMLDDAIEYLKSLQLQVQMMTMGCGMVPMMYPASMQQFMQTGTMGMNMMGMCGMNRPPMVPPPYPPPPPLIPSSSSIPSPSPTAAAQMNPTRFPISPPFPFPVPDPSSRLHAPNLSGSVLTPLVARNPNQIQIPNFADPYKQPLGFHQAQVTLPLTVEHPINNKPSGSKDVGNHQS